MLAISNYIIPTVICFIVSYGLFKGVKVFDVFIEGAKSGLTIAVSILPALVALMTAVGMFKVSGGLDVISSLLAPAANFIGLPKEIIPLALLRPVSGSGGLVIFTDLLQTYGADSFIGRVASVIEGSTETTFYTIAVYFGATGISNTRHTVPSAMAADLTSCIIGVLAVRLLFGF